MDLSLRCNNHLNGYCRKDLRHEAYVTTCSHIFCRDCVQKYGFHDPTPRRECLACGISLPSAGDVVFTTLRPAEERQSTILSGFDPTTIMDCATKAMKFWNYQMSTEIAWQEHLVKEMTNRYQNLHTNARKVVDDANTEIGELQKQIESLSFEKAEADKRVEEVVGMYKEKSKHCQTLSHLYEALKSKVQAEQTRDAAALSAENTLQSLGSIARPESNVHHRVGYARSRNSTEMPSAKKTSDLSNYPVDQHGIERLHPYQRSGGSIQRQVGCRAPVATTNIGDDVSYSRQRTAGSVNVIATPDQRVNLPRHSTSHTLPRPTHHASMLQQFTSRPLDRRGFEAQETVRQEHSVPGQFARTNAQATPNMHSRMPANRGLY